MRIYPAFLGIVLVMAVGEPRVSRAQVAVGINLPVSRVLIHEALKAEVFIKNSSGRLLSFGPGEGSAKLRFHIEDAHGRIVWSRGGDSILDGVDIMPGKTGKFDVPLSGYYSFHAPGRYKIMAVADWNHVSYGSRNVSIEVVRGVELMKTRSGVPGDDRAMRLYVLEYIQRGNDEHLYLRIEDEREGVLYGVFNIGRVVRVRKPELTIDEPGNVHVFFWTIGARPMHVSYTPYGDFLFSRLVDSESME